MSDLTRRTVLGAIVTSTAGAACGRKQSEGPSTQETLKVSDELTTAHAQSGGALASAVHRIFPLQMGRPWPTPDPFLFCVHHNDRYPRGNGQYGPAASLAGRQMGQDFDWKDGWNMYHGRTVPGFPSHPHRGFETVTVVREGRLDHADSLGAAARYGDGDVQWLTAGAGIQHAEMFPLLDDEKDNPLDLFQIWLNLPKKSKMVAPYFSMMWAHEIPHKEIADGQGKKTVVSIRAGELAGARAPSPPPDSWAYDPNNEVGIWTCALEDGAKFELPMQKPGVNRMVYLYSGEKLSLNEREIAHLEGAELREGIVVTLEATAGPVEVLILSGRGIGEPVAKSGPFVMNTEEELRQAYQDFRTTRFGGWPWADTGPVHGADRARFARRSDGKIERPEEG